MPLLTTRALLSFEHGPVFQTPHPSRSG